MLVHGSLEEIGGFGVSFKNGRLYKKNSLSAVMSDQMGDSIMYAILTNPELKSIIGDYSFLNLKPSDMHIDVGFNKESKECELIYTRPKFNHVVTYDKWGITELALQFQVTKRNIYQLAVIALTDLIVFNSDRTTIRFGHAGHQHLENMMLHRSSIVEGGSIAGAISPISAQYFSFLPIDNSWGHIFIIASREEMKWLVQEYEDTIKYALDNMQKFAEEYLMNNRLLFAGVSLNPMQFIGVMKGWERKKWKKPKDEYKQAFYDVWDKEFGDIVVKIIKEKTEKLEDEYLKDIVSKCKKLGGTLTENSPQYQAVMTMRKHILENAKIYEETKANKWVASAKYRSYNGYDEWYHKGYVDAMKLITRLRGN